MSKKRTIKKPSTSLAVPTGPSDGSLLRKRSQADRVRDPLERLKAIMDRWEAPKSEATLESYRKSLNDYATFASGYRGAAYEDSQQALWDLVNAGRDACHRTVRAYLDHLRERKMAPRTRNHRLAALRSFVGLAETMGVCTWNINAIKGDRVKGVKDVRGPGVPAWAALVGAAEKDARSQDVVTAARGARDVAMLSMMLYMGLRRAEICRFKRTDVVDAEQKIWILGKGAGKLEEREKILRLVPAIAWARLLRWMSRRPRGAEALFTTSHRGMVGEPLTLGAMNWIVRERAIEAGFLKGKMPDGRTISPHGFRHTAITEALRKSEGNVALVQSFSRHTDPKTLMIYNDALGERVGEAQDMLERGIMGQVEDERAVLEGPKKKTRTSKTPKRVAKKKGRKR